jgi:hypothetical protein
MANHPASGKAGIAPLFAFEHHWPGLPEPGRSAMKHAVAICVLSLSMCGCVCVDGVREGFTLRVQIESASPGPCNVYHLDGSRETECIQTNGIHLLDVPVRPWGETRCFGIAMGSSAPDYVVVRRDGKVIERVTVERVSSSPATPSGAHVLRVK